MKRLIFCIHYGPVKSVYWPQSKKFLKPRSSIATLAQLMHEYFLQILTDGHFELFLRHFMGSKFTILRSKPFSFLTALIVSIFLFLY